MKICCCYTPAHEVLFRGYFLPSLPAGLVHESHRLEIPGGGDFLSPEFLQCIRRKITLIRESLIANSRSVILWSDVDIVFQKDMSGVILAAFDGNPDLRLLVQREARRLPDVNTGFLALRCSAETEDFFARVEARLASEPDKNEQAVVNDLLLRDGDPICWDYLPWSFYARTHGWPPPRETHLYHANYTKGADGVGQKIAQFEEFAWMRKHGRPARLWTCLKRAMEKVRQPT
jgi:hypothetical protein